MQTIHQSFIASVEANPGKALFERPGQPDITYADARTLVQRFAAVLSDAGVQPGDRVAVQTDKSPEAICLYLATLQVGGVYLPLNTAYTGAEIDYFLGDAAPRLFVCTPATLAEHKARESDAMRIESLGGHGDGSLMALAAAATPRADRVARGMDDPAAILYTSGTTGRSRGGADPWQSCLEHGGAFGKLALYGR